MSRNPSFQDISKKDSVNSNFASLSFSTYVLHCSFNVSLDKYLLFAPYSIAFDINVRQNSSMLTLIKLKRINLIVFSYSSPLSISNSSIYVCKNIFSKSSSEISDFFIFLYMFLILLHILSNIFLSS